VELLAVIVAVALGGGGLWWWRRRGRDPGARPAPAIDPFTVGERWRRHVTAANGALRRYREIVAATPPGPRRDQLAAITRQVEHGVGECGLIAKRGHELDKAAARIDVTTLRTRLAATDDPTAKASLQAQLDAGERLRAMRDDADEQLARLNDRLGELVARAAEVGAAGSAPAELGTALDDVVTRLEALRLAIDEVETAARPAAIPPEITAVPTETAALDEGPGQASPST
jgi:hypothetical protein